MWKVFLTGATGFLGGELAVALSKLDSVEQINCLVRANDDNEAVDRLERVFALHEDLYDPRKVVAIRGNLTDERLSVQLARHHALKDVNLVIHSGANTSFLSQKYAAVAETNICGTQRIAQPQQRHIDHRHDDVQDADLLVIDGRHPVVEHGGPRRGGGITF